MLDLECKRHALLLKLSKLGHYNNLKMKNLKIISLGGFGSVTANMFVYETDKDILVVDCGIGFPEEEMLGIDLVIPDITYLKERQYKLKGIVISHGHEDHVGALPYILPQLKDIPVFAPRWAKALAEAKFKEFRLRHKIKEFNKNSRISLGNFALEFIPATHSIPDTYHLVIKTPIGVFYHAADFKLDLTPVISQPTNQERIKGIGQNGVLCILSDCVRAELPGFTPSESQLEEVFEREIKDCQGKFLVTTFSSNISRWKQAIDVSLRHNRKILLLGRSVEQNIKIALKLKYLHYSPHIFITKRQLTKYPPNQITALIAGAQAQTGSSLDRLVAGELNQLEIKPSDKVVFSSDYIPGNEAAIYALIDNLYRLGAEVSYTDIKNDVHVSGHGSQKDLGKLIEMVKPKYLLPIGGNFRHMVAYQRLAAQKGYQKNQILLPDIDQMVKFINGEAKVAKGPKSKTIMVDALGVGDVGNVVLRDRRILSEEGIVVAIISLDQNTRQLIGDPEIISRGFIYIKESLALLNSAKREIVKTLKTIKSRKDPRFLRFRIQAHLEEFFFAETGRRPMILPVIIEV